MRRLAFHERELQKKQREIIPCRVFAKTINEIGDTDYDVPDAQYQLEHCREPIDVVLRSKSGAYPERHVQVTTIPTDLELRDDNQNIAKLEGRVKTALLERNVSALQLEICLAQYDAHRSMPVNLVGPLADLIHSMPRRQAWRIEWQGISALSVELATYVTDVISWPLSSDSLFVHAGRGCFIPENLDRFIDEAIQQKGSSYSPRDEATMALVIAASSAILPEHMRDYLSRRGTPVTSFSEVWVVLAHGESAIPLKR